MHQCHNHKSQDKEQRYHVSYAQGLDGDPTTKTFLKSKGLYIKCSKIGMKTSFQHLQKFPLQESSFFLSIHLRNSLACKIFFPLYMETALL